MQMQAETLSIVNDLKAVKIEQVAFEALTNSIHADATEIEISLNCLNADFANESTLLVHEIKVTDNGHGFKPKDLESFGKYRSRHKKVRFGAKGVGRFLFLKLFENVNIASLNKEIKFNLQQDVVISDSNSYADKTELLITTPKDKYQIDKTKFTNDVKLHFLPLFKLINSTVPKKSISIIVKYDNEEYETIKSDDIPEFKECEFEAGNHLFKISYLLNNAEYMSGDGAYCAGGRVVCFNSQMEQSKRFNAFKGIHFFYLLSSEYFDSNLNLPFRTSN